MLSKYERKFLGLIFGAVCINGGSITIKNSTNHPDTVGHLERMDDNTAANKIYNHEWASEAFS